jgi:DNA-binding CsgD family transcriptional regulator
MFLDLALRRDYEIVLLQRILHRSAVWPKCGGGLMSAPDDPLNMPGPLPGKAAVDPAAAHDDWHTLLTRIDWDHVGWQLGLSTRELEVVQHIMSGQKLTAVARDLGLSLGTVKTYSQRVHHKLCVTDQRELILAILDCHLTHTQRSL